jgi:hypothetical protein
MEQQPEQRVIGRPFARGQSGNPHGRASRKQRHAEMMARLAADCGGIEALSPGDQVLLARAVDLLLLKPTTQDDGVRLLNAATRLVEGIRRRYRARRDSAAMPLRDQLAGAR